VKSETFSVRVPGSTSNVGSGFDTVSAALGVYLDLKVTVTPEMGIRWPPDWPLKAEENAIDWGLRRSCEMLGIDPPGLEIEVRNDIPLKRGLGSSAAALVAGLKMGERLAGRRLGVQEAFDLVYPLEGHPDNLAASLLGGWVISRVDGARMRAERMTARLRCRFVAAIPQLTVSTRDARAILPKTCTLADTVFNLQRCALLVFALTEGRGDLLREAVEDRIHQEYRAGLIPGAGEILSRAGLPSDLDASILSLTVSGSGSTLLALADDRYDEIGSWMVRVLADAGVASSYRVLHLDAQGARVTDGGPARLD
jgi:homoserine kinase